LTQRASKINDLEGTIRELVNVKNDKTNEIEDISNSEVIEELRQTVCELNEKLIEQSYNIKAQDGTITTLQGQVDEKDESLRLLESKCGELVASKTVDSSKLEIYIAAEAENKLIRAELEDSVKELSEQVSKYSHDLQSLQLTLNEKQVRIDELEKSVLILTEELRSPSHTKEEFPAEIDTTNQHDPFNQETTREVNVLENQIHQLNSDLEVKSAALLAKEGEVEVLQRSVQEVQQQAKEACARYEEEAAGIKEGEASVLMAKQARTAAGCAAFSRRRTSC
jgi:predicted  nucleic acid-binding Zn-ribbon protein